MRRAMRPPPAPEDLTRLLALAQLKVDLADLPPRSARIIRDTEPCPPPLTEREYMDRWFPPRPEGGL